MEPENKSLGHRLTGEAQNKFVHTYAEDMAEVITNDKEGLIKKIIHGEEEHEQEKKNLSPESKKNKIFMLVGVVLIFLALATLGVFIFNKPGNTITVQKQFVPIIFTDGSSNLEIAGLKKDEIAQAVLNEVNATKVKTGGVEGIYLTENKQIIGLRRFVTLINASFVAGDNPLFVNDNFLMGSVDNSFFLLIKVRSTADIFDSMRNWENKMLTDMRGFLGLNVGADTSYLFKKNFEDGIIENKNARILYDTTGKIILMYIFADDNSVLITNGGEAAHEIVLRLAGSQIKQ
jgi:hypothetical protein